MAGGTTIDTSGVAAGEELAYVLSKRGVPEIEPGRDRDRGQGPFKRMVLRGARILLGTGAPPIGIYDIVVENGRIKEVVLVGVPKTPINPERRPAPGDFEIDCTGKLVTPGFIDAHVHIGTHYHATMGPMPPADYVYKLWLAHGITTVREMGAMNGLGWTLRERERSAKNEIAAPKIVSHAYFPGVDEFVKTIYTPDAAREWVRKVKDRGADGLKFFGAPPAIMKAALEEARKVGLKTGCHHMQMSVAKMNALNTASWGLDTTEHFYGIPEAMFTDRALQSYPVGYDFMDESLRYASGSQNFVQAAEPGSAKWQELLEKFLELGHGLVPTLAILEANRDLMRARRADWHDEYTHKTVWKYFQPHRGGHCSHWYRWTTTQEVQWKEHFRRWMRFCNDYKNMGGRVCPGSDAGFTFQLYGFCYIREFEQMQEAGFHPLEIFRAATSDAAALLGVEEDRGTIEPGKAADLIVHALDPLEDIKVLYGTGAMRLNDETRKTEWHRGIQYTIKDGVVFDVAELLADVRAMVKESFADGEDDDRPKLPH